jgi:peptide/nickel transport system permease protein
MEWRSPLADKLSSPRRSRVRLGDLGWGTRIALGGVVLLVLVAIFGPYLVPFDPTKTNSGPIAHAPGGEHLLGTDQYGRDVFSRVVAGAQVSVSIGLGATLLALAVGSVLGALAATSRRAVNETIMRGLDIVMAFPAVIIAACVAAAVRPGVLTTLVVIAALYVPPLARVVYANVLAQYAEDYVPAARLMGSRRSRVLIRHVAVNCAVPVLVFTATIVADAIVIESSLSFLGLGIQGPTPSWGNVIADGKELIYSGGWWVALFGGCGIFLTVLALNVLAEGVSDALAAPRRASDGGEAAIPVASWRRDRDELRDAPERGALLQVDRLSIRFPGTYGDVPLVSDVSFDIHEGEVIGVVGESGCGKSLTGLAVMGLLPDGAEVTGSIRYRGEDLLQMSAGRRRGLLGREIAMIYQDALSSLNPGMSIGAQLRQVCRRGARRSPEELLSIVELSAANVLRAYPHQLSGGQRQRVLIALALVAELADRVLVMYAGQLVEAAASGKLVSEPAHPYSTGLLASIRSLEEGATRLAQIDGTVPSPVAFPAGCRFAGRCPNETAVCRDAAPPMRRAGDRQFLACYHPVRQPLEQHEAAR